MAIFYIAKRPALNMDLWGKIKFIEREEKKGIYY